MQLEFSYTAKTLQVGVGKLYKQILSFSFSTSWLVWFVNQSVQHLHPSVTYGLVRFQV